MQSKLQSFSNFFKPEFEHLQNSFGNSFGINSVITNPDGHPISPLSEQASLQLRICQRIKERSTLPIAQTDSTAKTFGDSSLLHHCLASGLCCAETKIYARGHLIANWFIGPVRTKSIELGQMKSYAQEIGASEEAIDQVVRNVPEMTIGEVAYVAKALSNNSHTISRLANHAFEEEILREGEEHFRTIVESSPMGICQFQLDLSNQLVLLGANSAAEELIGVKMPELLNAPIEKVFPPFVDYGIVDHCLRAVEEGVTWTTREFYYNESGTNGYFDITAFRSGPKRLGLMFSNVTERVLAEQRSEDSKARLDSIFRASPTGIGMVVDRIMVHVNDRLCRMLDYSAEELLGQSVRMIFADHDECSNILSMKHDQISKYGIASIETHWRTKNGLVKNILLSSSCLDPSDLSKGITFTALDITERKQLAATHEKLEAQLRHSQKMQAVGQLAGGVAHEFNNLLTAISGNIDLALSALPPGSEAWNDLYQANKASSNAAELVGELLTFAHRDTLHLVQLDLNSVITDLGKMLRCIIGENIELSLNVKTDLPLIVADAGMVRQTVMNLAINARDAMPQGGRICLSTESASLNPEFCRDNPWARSGHYVTLSVSDNGKGIPPEVQERIFEPFFTTKEAGKGTGLGLANVYAIVERHGGFIHLSSIQGQGTTFTIYFPESEQQFLATEERVTRKPPGGTETILLAEDDDLVRSLTNSVLTRAGYKTIVASDGEEAERLVAVYADNIALAMLDVIMPKKNGPEVATYIKARHPRIPILFASGYSPNIIDAENIPKIGLLIHKPFGREDLLQQVRDLIDKSCLHN